MWPKMKYFLSIRMETLPSTFLKSDTNVPTLPTQNFPTSQHFLTNGTAKILSEKKRTKHEIYWNSIFHIPVI